jgi:hypothetical protein
MSGASNSINEKQEHVLNFGSKPANSNYLGDPEYM